MSAASSRADAGVYTVTVSNAGGTPSSGAVTMTDTLPDGLDSVIAAGSGWTCNVSDHTIPCSRSDALASGQSFPPNTLTISVQPNAPPSVTKTVSVVRRLRCQPGEQHCGRCHGNRCRAQPDHDQEPHGQLHPGQTGAVYILTVSNTGGSPSSGPVTLIDTVPAGLTPTSATGAGWSCTVGGQSVTCMRSDALNPGASYPPVTIMVDVAMNAPAMLINTAQLAGGGDVDPGGNTVTDPTTVYRGAGSDHHQEHTGSLVQTQLGNLQPHGLEHRQRADSTTRYRKRRLTGEVHGDDGCRRLLGCNVAGQKVSCSRSDALNAGASYPVITLTVNVSASAPSSLSNTAIVSGGGEVNTGNSFVHRRRGGRARPRPDRHEKPFRQLPAGTDRAT